jgi:predicted outer membrane protein
MSSADQQIAALIYGACHNEVEIAKFAQSKLQLAEARAFAEKMVSDHTPDCESYQRWAGKLGAETALRPEGDAAAAAPGAEGIATGQRPGGNLDWTKIHEQFAQLCLASAKQELGRKQGAEFDKCFIGLQLGGHIKMQDELKVLRNHASPELKQQIDKTLQVVQGHLQESRQLMEQLKDSPSERVSRRPEDTKK